MTLVSPSKMLSLERVPRLKRFLLPAMETGSQCAASNSAGAWLPTKPLSPVNRVLPIWASMIRREELGVKSGTSEAKYKGQTHHFDVRSLLIPRILDLGLALGFKTRAAVKDLFRTFRSHVKRSSMSYHLMAKRLGICDDCAGRMPAGLPVQLRQIAAAGCVVVGRADRSRVGGGRAGSQRLTAYSSQLEACGQR